MTQQEKDLFLKDLCARLPYGVKAYVKNWSKLERRWIENVCVVKSVYPSLNDIFVSSNLGSVEVILGYDDYVIKPYLFPLSSMTDEDYAIYSKIWEDTGRTAYLEGCHHLISTINAYKAANDYLLSKQYDINGLIPKGLANDATGLNIY